MIIIPRDKTVVSLLPQKDAKQVLLALFSEGDDLPEMTPLANMAYTAIKSKSEQISKSKSKAGKAGGAPKGNRNAAKQIKETELTGTSETSTGSSEPSIRLRNLSTDADDYGDVDDPTYVQERQFAEFWASYPRKVGKEAARKAWLNIKPTADHHSKILAAVEQAKKCEQWQRENGRYIPHPSTWLNQGRWDDEIPPNSTLFTNKILGNFYKSNLSEYDDEFYERFISNNFGKGGQETVTT